MTMTAGTYIDGQARDGRGSVAVVVDPATGDPVAEVTQASVDDVDAGDLGGRSRGCRVGRPDRGRAGQDPAAARRRDGGGRRAPDPARGRGHGQAARGLRRRRAAVRCRQPALLRRLRTIPRGLRCRRALAGLHLDADPAADRGRRRYRPVELPLGDGDLEARARPCRGQHDGAQAGARDAAQHAAPRRARQRCRGCRRACSTSSRAARMSGRPSSATITSAWSRSPGPRARAGRSCRLRRSRPSASTSSSAERRPPWCSPTPTSSSSRAP